MDPIWKISLFGELRGHCECGADFTPGVSRAGALFAYLALSPGQAYSRDYLAALFWPEAEASSARTRLRQELRNLRQQVEPEDIPVGSVLTRERDSIALVSSSIETDVEAFRQALAEARTTEDDRERERLLAKAVSLYRGRLLSGYDYDRIVAERAHLEAGFETALRELAARRQARGDLEGAETCLRRLVAENPYLEEAHTDLMRLFAVKGNLTQLRKQYQELERMLRKEFDAEPSAATSQLMERLCQEIASSLPIPSSAAVPIDPSVLHSANGFDRIGALPVENSLALLSSPTETELPILGRAKPLRYLAGVLILLACLPLFGIYRFLHRSPSRPLAVTAPRPDSIALQWGREEWVYTYPLGPGEKPNSEPKAMTVSGSDIYVTGFCQTEKEDVDILTLKLSPDRKLLWRRRYSGPEHDCDRAYSIANAPQGGVYVAGESYIPARPGVPEGWRLVVIRYAGDGKQLWVQRSPLVTKNADMAIQVLPNEKNGCWVGGTALINGSPHLMVLRYDDTGKLLWTQTTRQESTFSHLAGVSNDIFACGTSQRHDTHGTYGRWLVSCFDRNGKRTWEQTVEGPGQGGSTSQILQERTSLYVSGVFQTGDIARGGHGLNPGVAKLSADNGQLLWTQCHPVNSLTYRVVGLSFDAPCVRIIGARTLLDSILQGEVMRYGADGSLIWERQCPIPAEFHDVAPCLTESGALGMRLASAKARTEGDNTLLAMGIDAYGAYRYALAVRPGGKGLHEPRAIEYGEEGLVYFAAQSFGPQRPTITVTKFRPH